MIGNMQAKLLQRLSGVTRRFARQKDGAVAVEFALVAAPFLADRKSTRLNSSHT